MKRTTLITIISSIVIYTTVVSCKKEHHYAPERVKSELITVTNNTGENTAIVSFIAPYKNAIQSEMDSVLAVAPASYTKKDSKLNTAVGNMMADAVYEMTNPVFEKRAGYPFNAVLLNY